MDGASPPHDSVQLDKNPSPKDEARDFQNPDEKLLAANNAHTLAVIEAKRGWVGKITGSTNESMNTGLLILLACLVVLAGSMVGSCFKPEVFTTVIDSLIKIILAVAGYIFGTQNTSKPN